MNKLSLDATAREHLRAAKDATNGRSAETVYGGHERVLRQTVMALVAGTTIAEHDRAACGPHLKHLAGLAAAAAADGVPAAEWRTDVLTRIGPSARGPLDSAEACMRQAGLWPWNPGSRTGVDLV